MKVGRRWTKLFHNNEQLTFGPPCIWTVLELTVATVDRQITKRMTNF